jgi:membrane-associated phospholipid phosphatase
LPIFTWLALYFTCGKIPNSWKPAISVKVLPALETILYGDNLSNVLATILNSVLDLLAWLPYGIIHFASPFIVAIFIFLFAPPTSLRSFGFAFGYMNLLGVLTQLLFPAAPPWYKNLHGLEPANYGMQGSPGGLGRIDELFGVDMYTTTFSNSPVIFGAFPSLHSGCAVMDVLFLSWLFPKLRVVWWGYACWLWWCTMYLTHHYFIDLIGGAVLSLLVYTYTKYNFLPIIDHNKFCRWSYVEVSLPNYHTNDPLNNQFVSLSSTDIENQLNNESISNNNSTLFEMSNFQTRNKSKPSLIPIDEESDMSSINNSSPPLLFEDYHQQMSQATSTTSLDEEFNKHR